MPSSILSHLNQASNNEYKYIRIERLGDEERRLMHLVPAPAVRLMNRRVLSRPDISLLFGRYFCFLSDLISFVFSYLMSDRSGFTQLVIRRVSWIIYQISYGSSGFAHIRLIFAGDSLIFHSYSTHKSLIRNLRYEIWEVI